MDYPHEFTTTIDLGVLGEKSVTVIYDYIAARPGYLDGPPELCYPSEPAEIFVNKLIWADPRWNTIQWRDLTEEAREDLKSAILTEEITSAAEARAEIFGANRRRLMGIEP